VKLILLLVVTTCPSIAEAAGKRKPHRSHKTIEAGEGAHVPRKPLVRHERPPSSIQISARGTSLGRGNQTRHRNPGGIDQGGQVAYYEGEDFTKMCVDFPRVIATDAADPIATGQFLCSGDTCKKEEYSEAGDKCCNCDGGAQFLNYENTQCTGDEGLSRVGDYDGMVYKNPEGYLDVETCMQTCWGMGAECTGITVIDDGSAFAGMCYYRKGNLKYTNQYDTCADSKCEQRKDEVGEDVIEINDIPGVVKPLDVNDTRLPLCDDDAAFANTECESDPAKAKPRYHPAPAPPPLAQDDVVDKRDCFVKYLWYLASPASLEEQSAI